MILKKLGLKCPVCDKSLQNTSFGLDCKDGHLYEKFKKDHPEHADFDFEKATDTEKTTLFMSLMGDSFTTDENSPFKSKDMKENLSKLGDILNKMKDDMGGDFTKD